MNMAQVLSEVKIIFKIHYQTHFGENLYVVGNIPELGNWNLHQSFPLKYVEVR